MSGLSGGGLKFAIAPAVIASTAPAWAVNKCTVDGQVVFQDAACPGKGEATRGWPASGAARNPVTPATGMPVQGAPTTEAQRLESNIASSQKERLLRDLEQRKVPGAEQTAQANLQVCQDDHARLERSKGMFVQNLYVKADASQKTAEQAALASRCDTKDRELRDALVKLRDECKQLGGCK